MAARGATTWATWAIIVAIVVFLFWNGDGDPVAGVEDLLSRIERGDRLTRAPYDKATGVVPGEPAALAAEAGLDLDTYALARMVSSEEGSSSNAIKAAVCWATINYAAKVGKSISDLLLHATEPTHSNQFGTYKNIDEATPGHGKGDRYASTALDPYDGDGQIAAACISGQLADMTQGAIQFDRPAGEHDPSYTQKKREGAGLHQVEIDGIDSSEIRFWA